MLAQGFRDRTEDNTSFRQLLLEGRHHGHAVEHGIDRHPRALDAGQHFLFLQRDAEFFVGTKQFRVDFV